MRERERKSSQIDRAEMITASRCRKQKGRAEGGEKEGKKREGEEQGKDAEASSDSMAVPSGLFAAIK